jgi:hypothetical protein
MIWKDQPDTWCSVLNTARYHTLCKAYLNEIFPDHMKCVRIPSKCITFTSSNTFSAFSTLPGSAICDHKAQTCVKVLIIHIYVYIYIQKQYYLLSL